MNARVDWSYQFYASDGSTPVGNARTHENVPAVGRLPELVQVPQGAAKVRLILKLRTAAGGSNPPSTTWAVLKGLSMVLDPSPVVARNATPMGNSRVENLIPNDASSPYEGTSGWVTPTVGNYAYWHVGDNAMAFVFQTGKPAIMKSETFPVTPGKKVSWTYEGVNAGGTPTYLYFEFYDSTGNLVGTPVQHKAFDSYLGNLKQYGPAQTVPAGAYSASLVFRARSNDTLENIHFSGSFTFKNVTVAESDNASDVELIDFVPRNQWLDITGPTTNVEIVREGGNVGTLAVTIKDKTLDPATAPDVRKGKPVRVMAKSGYGEWGPLFTGTVTEASTTYVPDTTISIQASDNMTKLANVSRPVSVASINALPEVIEGAGVPWSVNDDSGQLDYLPIAVAYNENSTAVDQVALTCDSNNGYFWIDRYNVLRAYDYWDMLTGYAYTLDESTYSDVSVDFNPENIINVCYCRINSVD